MQQLHTWLVTNSLKLKSFGEGLDIFWLLNDSIIIFCCNLWKMKLHYFRFIICMTHHGICIYICRCLYYSWSIVIDTMHEYITAQWRWGDLWSLLQWFSQVSLIELMSNNFLERSEYLSLSLIMIWSRHTWNMKYCNKYLLCFILHERIVMIFLLVW